MDPAAVEEVGAAKDAAQVPDVEQVPARGGALVLDAEPGVVSGWDQDEARARDDALDGGPVLVLHAEHGRREGAASMD
ncbi:hypothetical protein Brsp01_50500 [Brucella sp. NBRC 12950]|nr:hypothetical protein Brsp01_50500 [Brucella sp. NBRC 12950]